MNMDLLLLGLSVIAFVVGLFVINHFENKRIARTEKLWKEMQDMKKERKARVWQE